MCVRVQPPTAAPPSSLPAPAAPVPAAAAAAAKGPTSGQSALLSSGAISSTADGQLRHKVHVSPLSLPSLRSYLRHDYPASLMDDSFLSELQHMADGIAQPATSASAQHASHRGPAPPQQPQAAQSITSLLCCPASFCLTAGTDRVVRFWDLHEPLDSYRVTGPPLADDGLQARYSGRIENSSVVMEETMQHSAAADGGTADQQQQQQQLMKLAVARKSRGATPPASCHQSEIVDMKAIEFPQKMLATASTDGVIKVWL